MSYKCQISLRDIEKKSKYSRLKSNSHKEFEKYKQIVLSLKNVDIKDVDEKLFSYTIDHNNKFDDYLIIGEFKLVLNDNQVCKYKTTGMIDNKPCISWSNYMRDVIDNLKKVGFLFNYLAEMDILTLAQKRNLT